MRAAKESRRDHDLHARIDSSSRARRAKTSLTTRRTGRSLEKRPLKEHFALTAHVVVVAKVKGGVIVG